MRYVWATATHVGQVRSGNEDSVHPPDGGAGPGPVLTLVADGMGGHVGGEVASRVAVEAAVAAEGSPEERVVAANRAVVARVLAEPALSGMGTTLTVAEIDEHGKLSIGHVGDSRAYLFRDGALTRITTDHSVVAELLEAGRITEEEVHTHPQRSLVTRALGMARWIDVDTFSEQLRPGDRVLLCSDGLTTMLSDDEVGAALRTCESAEEAAQALVDLANQAGGHDNITVVVVDAAGQ